MEAGGLSGAADGREVESMSPAVVLIGFAVPVLIAVALDRYLRRR